LVNKRSNKLIRFANIQTATGKTKHSSAVVHLLEVTATEETARLPSVEISETESEDCPTPSERPVH